MHKTLKRQVIFILMTFLLNILPFLGAFNSFANRTVPDQPDLERAASVCLWKYD